VEGQRAVAVREEQQHDRRREAHDDQARHRRRVQRLGLHDQRQQADRRQHHDDHAAPRQVPARVARPGLVVCLGSGCPAAQQQQRRPRCQRHDCHAAPRQVPARVVGHLANLGLGCTPAGPAGPRPS